MTFLIFEYQNSKSPIFRWFRYFGVWHLNPRCSLIVNVGETHLLDIGANSIKLFTVVIRLPDMSNNQMVKTYPIAKWFANWMVGWHLWTIRPFGYQTFSPLFKPPFGYQTKSLVTEWSVDIYGPLDHSVTGLFLPYSSHHLVTQSHLLIMIW